MNDDRNQNRDKPQDERFLSGDLIFSLNLIKYSIDSEKKSAVDGCSKILSRVCTTKVVVAFRSCRFCDA